ncbi:SMP-30/gluconolactonase/LRE family protein [Pseudorhodobacter sp.]|uniref:SMP-30/gluconolactonase/LRE family protein n=1 Tax=Pseudorhodobacter sp. TaxID=1934400 RepID=UPI002648F22C|nr:SMP-30/gluconolactonase/LRE family protein [Pseudorhodobacter sp.]MDN5787249.1 SMP-30/gluconolactonase/LRE family protein [Pseudorhodobacter sp.]
MDMPLAPFVDVIDTRFAKLLLGNAVLETLATGFRWTEGPVWMGDWNCLLFQDLPNDRTMRWIDGVGTSVFRQPSGYANGQARDPAGRLIWCSHGARAILRMEHDGSVVSLAQRHDGKVLNAPNDIAVKSDGTIWFSDPLYGLQSDYEGGRRHSEQGVALYRLDPADDMLQVMSDDFGGPNGLMFSPDERRLYVAETGDQTKPEPEQNIRVFDVSSDGRQLSNRSVFHTISPGYCDGMTVDEYGNLWSSAADGVHCIAPDGALLGKVLVPERVSTVTFGAQKLNRLFITASSSLYAIYLNCRGVSR